MSHLNTNEKRKAFKTTGGPNILYPGWMDDRGFGFLLDKISKIPIHSHLRSVTAPESDRAKPHFLSPPNAQAKAVSVLSKTPMLRHPLFSRCAYPEFQAAVAPAASCGWKAWTQSLRQNKACFVQPILLMFLELRASEASVAREA